MTSLCPTAGNSGASAELSTLPHICPSVIARWHTELSYLLAFAHAVPTVQHAFSCLILDLPKCSPTPQTDSGVALP